MAAFTAFLWGLDPFQATVRRGAIHPYGFTDTGMKTWDCS